MRVIRTSGLTSGDGKRGVAAWPKPPRPSSTLPGVWRAWHKLLSWLRIWFVEANLRHFREAIPAMNDPMLPLPGLDHGDDLRQILIQGRSDSVLLVAAPTGMEPVARKTAGFLVSVQLN